MSSRAPRRARAIFAERVDGKFTLRRGFALAPGEEVIVAEDVITTGGSVREVAGLVENNGAHVAGFAALAERRGSGNEFSRAQVRPPASAAGDLSAGQLSLVRAGAAADQAGQPSRSRSEQPLSRREQEPGARSDR